MINGFLFPGQGSQAVGMGGDLLENKKACSLLDKACDILGFDLKRLMFEGAIEELTDTRNAQPAIYVCSAMYLEKAKERLSYDFVAGHSMGEYSALYAAGVYSFEEGLKLVQKRSELMAEQNGKGGMAAVLGMEEDALLEVLEKYPSLVIANLNAKTQLVISGEIADLDELASELDGKDGVKVRKLNVSAAFHSPQMREVADEMSEYIDAVEFNDAACTVISNVTGKDTRDPDVLKKNLKAQMTGQVRWYDSVQLMKGLGVECFYEVGYGDVLRKMHKTIMFKPKCLAV